MNISIKNTAICVIIGINLVVFNSIHALGQNSSQLAATPGAPAGSYQLGDFDNVNLFSGNLNFDLPLISQNGRGKTGIGVGLTFENQWTIAESASGPLGQTGVTIENHLVNTLHAAGFLFSKAKIVQTSQGCLDSQPIYWTIHQLSLTLVEPNGTEHTLVDPETRGREAQWCGLYTGINYGRNFQSVDGTFASFVADSDVIGYGGMDARIGVSGLLTLKDGTRFRFDNGKTAWVLDTNGNKTLYYYDPNREFPNYTPRPIRIVDSINREINIDYDVNDSAPYGLCHRIRFLGTNGQERVIRISLGAVTRSTQHREPVSKVVEMISHPCIIPFSKPVGWVRPFAAVCRVS